MYKVVTFLKIILIEKLFKYIRKNFYQIQMDVSKIIENSHDSSKYFLKVLVAEPIVFSLAPVSVYNVNGYKISIFVTIGNNNK